MNNSYWINNMINTKKNIFGWIKYKINNKDKRIKLEKNLYLRLFSKFSLNI